nr:glycoside hydrolase family 78 protein [Parabacteroides sp. FAFU027]
MKNTRLLFSVLFFTLFINLFAANGSGNISLSSLRCEMMTNPQGIGITHPRLSWAIASSERGIVQTAYRIVVASSAQKLAAGGDLWDSGKIASSQSTFVPYAGAALSSNQTCFWKVKIYTSKGESDWSAPATFSTGLLSSKEWKGKWIGLDKSFAWDSANVKISRLSARYFRKEFALPKKIKHAYANIIGLGLYELYINGQRVGKQVLAPVPTNYSAGVKFNTFDVTTLLRNGSNAVGTILGNGRFFTMRQNFKPYKIRNWGMPRMLFQLDVEYTDGTRQLIVSDDSWKVTSDGPIRTNNEYDGEEYDATKEMPGWNKTGFNDKKWASAELVKAPEGKIEPQLTPNMQIMQMVKPVAVLRSKSGKYILDMGQNMAGWLRISVKGKKGDEVTLRFAESLDANGDVDVVNLRDARSKDKYKLSGKGIEVWQPHFTYHGFRYVEITGWPGIPVKENFEGLLIYDEMASASSFTSSATTLNQIYRNAWWGIASNYKGMPVDCPQRNERQPWLGDRGTGSYGESFLFDNYSVYTKWLDDIEQSQREDGSIPDVSPAYWNYYSDNVTWPSTFQFVADMIYRQYGDKSPIVAHYPSMKKWMQYMSNKYMKDYIMTKDSYGDWCMPPESPELIHAKDSTRLTDGQLIASAYYFYLCNLMAKFASLSGNDADIAYYNDLGEKIKTAFNGKFYNQDKGYYGNNTVSANLFPFYFGMVPADNKARVLDNLIKKITIDNKSHISTGLVGGQWIMRGLTETGNANLAYTIATQRDYPSWGYMIEKGATAIWELWNGDTANKWMNSQNHVMLLGDLLIWYYENLAGIKSAEPGFATVEMNPAFPKDLSYVNASYESVYGKIVSDWKKSGNEFTWNITVPANTKAIVHIPSSASNQIMESGKAALSADGVKYLHTENERAVFEISSGEYHFSVK